MYFLAELQNYCSANYSVSEPSIAHTNLFPEILYCFELFLQNLQECYFVPKDMPLHYLALVGEYANGYAYVNVCRYRRVREAQAMFTQLCQYTWQFQMFVSVGNVTVQRWSCLQGYTPFTTQADFAVLC